jgi:hypothetical protein
MVARRLSVGRDSEQDIQTSSLVDGHPALELVVVATEDPPAATAAIMADDGEPAVGGANGTPHGARFVHDVSQDHRRF